MGYRSQRATRIVAVSILAFKFLPAAGNVHLISIDWTHPLKAFDPNVALGAGVDGHERGEVADLLSSANVVAMRSAGLKPLTYRLRTELAGEAWHWNPQGKWSDPAHLQGYWTSDATSTGTIDVSYGYRLPRRGNTIDQANNDGYSRITDGDVETFWKSNPYLGSVPQWAAVDLGRKVSLDSVKIHWGIPWATEYTLQYSVRDDLDVTSAGIWRDFSNGAQRAPNGGVVSTKIAAAPIMIRRIRVLMTASSGTMNPPGTINPPGTAATDPRDRIGFAIREIEAGTNDRTGRFRDAVRHRADRSGQSVVWVSSTDPWHRASDRDSRVEQPGLDRIFRSGLTNGLPMLTPVGTLYDTPENAVAEIRYLKARGYPVEEVELGEEPEEQQIPPEMYGALYRKWAVALHTLDPKLRVGGPSLVLLAPENQDHPSWNARWMADMRHFNALALIQFFSFEWYPFDEVCEPVAPQVAGASTLLKSSLEQLVADGVPRTIPWYLSEYGYSALGSQAEVELPGAILNADTVATFLAFGGAKAFLYGYEPGDLLNEEPCTWGNNMLFLNGRALQKMPTYYGARLLAEEWLMGSGGTHTVFQASTDDPSIGAYAVERPDHLTSLLLLNKDPARTISVSVPLRGTIDGIQYSAAQYRWKAAGESGHPTRNLPPAKFDVREGGEVRLPPSSISVVRGRAE